MLTRSVASRTQVVRRSPCEVSYFAAGLAIAVATVAMFDTIELEVLEEVTGGAGEGVMGWARLGLVGLSLATGNADIKAPMVDPIRVEQPISAPSIAGG